MTNQSKKVSELTKRIDDYNEKFKDMSSLVQNLLTTLNRNRIDLLE